MCLFLRVRLVKHHPPKRHPLQPFRPSLHLVAYKFNLKLQGTSKLGDLEAVRQQQRPTTETTKVRKTDIDDEDSEGMETVDVARELEPDGVGHGCNRGSDKRDVLIVVQFQ